MTVGICSRYLHHEATYLAAHVFCRLSRQGTPVKWATPDLTRHRLQWWVDRDVLCRPSLAAWAADLQSVVWTHVPTTAHVEYLKKRGVRTTIVPLWHEISELDLPALAKVDTVLTVSDVQKGFFSKTLSLPNVHAVLWDTGQPRRCKDFLAAPSPELRLVIPLFDGAVNRVESTFLQVVARTLLLYPHVSVTWSFVPNKLAGHARREVQRLRRKFAGRLIVVKPPPPPDRAAWLATFDLCVWPVSTDNTGLVPLMSLLSGTPAIMFGIPPLTDQFSTNSVKFVSVPVLENRRKLPVAIPDYSAFAEALWALIDAPSRLQEMNRSTLFGDGVRQREFSDIVQTRLCATLEQNR